MQPTIDLNFPDNWKSSLTPIWTENRMRLGNQNDGGYIVTKETIVESQVLISFGVGNDVSFEKDCVELNNGIRILMFDHTVFPIKKSYKFMEFLKAVLMLDSNLFFLKVKLYRDIKKLRKNNFKLHNQRINSFKYRNYDVTPSEIINNLQDNLSIFMKVDIEGFEYRIIEDIIVQHKNRINGLIVEFHELVTRENEMLRIASLISKNFFVESININNFGDISPQGIPDVVEITFTNRKFLNHLRTLEVPIKWGNYANGKNRSNFQFYSYT